MFNDKARMEKPFATRCNSTWQFDWILLIETNCKLTCPQSDQGDFISFIGVRKI